jgi:cytidyltransferase-like protein
MFHIGHLNLINHAKEHCDYLIVGVNADELVESYKHKTPVIREKERQTIVANIKAVDECIIVTSLDKVEAWKQLHFDALTETANRISAEKHRAHIGTRQRVLVDGLTGREEYNLSARTNGGRLVHLKGDPSLIGRFITVEITDGNTWALYGKEAKCDG